MEPEQLQLGFLKVLKGSRMYDMAETYGIVYRKKAPYEVLKTDWMSYDDILKLKGVEEMVEIYYNSHQFEQSVTYLMHFYKAPFDFLKIWQRFTSSADLAKYSMAECSDMIFCCSLQRNGIWGKWSMIWPQLIKRRIFKRYTVMP